MAGQRLGIEDIPAGFLEMAPDLAVEVVSPGDSGAAVQNRVSDWLATRTRLVWVVYPESRSIVVHRPDQPARELHDTDVLTGSPVLTDFAVQACDLFT